MTMQLHSIPFYSTKIWTTVHPTKLIYILSTVLFVQGHRKNPHNNIHILLILEHKVITFSEKLGVLHIDLND